MKGFTGYTYNGHPVFIREDYEDTHRNHSELDRIYDLTGWRYEDIDQAILDMWGQDESLVYRNYDREVDDKLRSRAGYLDGSMLWDPFMRGYVHRITGEYVIGNKPNRDSYPCWAVRETDPMSDSDRAYWNNRARGGLLFLGIGLLASLFSGGSDDTDDDSDDET